MSICVHKSKKCRPAKLCTKCMSSLITNLSHGQRHNAQETRRWMTDMQEKYNKVNDIVSRMEEALLQLEAAWAEMESDTDEDSDQDGDVIDLRQPFDVRNIYEGRKQ